jgi:hypothetical protein
MDHIVHVYYRGMMMDRVVINDGEDVEADLTRVVKIERIAIPGDAPTATISIHGLLVEHYEETA